MTKIQNKSLFSCGCVSLDCLCSVGACISVYLCAFQATTYCPGLVTVHQSEGFETKHYSNRKGLFPTFQIYNFSVIKQSPSNQRHLFLWLSKLPQQQSVCCIGTRMMKHSHELLYLQLVKLKWTLICIRENKQAIQ